MAGLDYVRAVQSGELPPPPIAVVMNFRIDELDEGRAVFIGEPGEEHYNPIGVVHGGYASTILDSALGCAVHTTLPAGVGYTSQTLEVKYLRPITRDTGAVRAEAEVRPPRPAGPPPPRRGSPPSRRASCSPPAPAPADLVLRSG